MNEYRPGQPVRIDSNAGPCLTGYQVVKVNRTTVTVEGAGIYAGAARRNVSLSKVNAAACGLCPGGATYPNGYQD